MSTRHEALPSRSAAGAASRLPGSRKVYVAGPRGMRVPFREIALSPTRGAAGQTELNPPLRVYDTSGPVHGPVRDDRPLRGASGAAASVDPRPRRVRPRRAVRARARPISP